MERFKKISKAFHSIGVILMALADIIRESCNLYVLGSPVTMYGNKQNTIGFN